MLMAKDVFSNELETWLRGKNKKTLSSLSEVFSEKSFAIVILVLMSFSALPLPTGGITNIFELISMLLALEMMLGKNTIWLPKSWGDNELGSLFKEKTIPFLIRRIRWFERFSRPRLEELINRRYFVKIIGFLLFLFCLAAFVAPPFSGLDTLPSLGTVILALSVILGDVVLFLLGCAVGSVGVGLIIALGTATSQVFKHLL